MINSLLDMTKKAMGTWESHLITIVGILIASNAYFVQRVISQLDYNTSQMYLLNERLAHIEGLFEAQHERDNTKKLNRRD